MEQLLLFLAVEGATWVRSERERLRPLASLLSQDETEALSPFFPPDLLAKIRVASEHQTANPTFYVQLDAKGIPRPFDFTQTAGITYDDTILISHSRAPTAASEYTSLLFHETVHVAQYARLGIDDFMRLYVLGWVRAGFSYSKIPLEVQAFRLQARFKARDSPFSVANLVEGSNYFEA